jgi:hypothetical protein
MVFAITDASIPPTTYMLTTPPIFASLLAPPHLPISRILSQETVSSFVQMDTSLKQGLAPALLTAWLGMLTILPVNAFRPAQPQQNLPTVIPQPTNVSEFVPRTPLQKTARSSVLPITAALEVVGPIYNLSIVCLDVQSNLYLLATTQQLLVYQDAHLHFSGTLFHKPVCLLATRSTESTYLQTQ